MPKTRLNLRVHPDSILDQPEQDRLTHCVRVAMFAFRDSVKEFEKVVEAGGTGFMTKQAAESMAAEFARYADEAGDLLDKLENAFDVALISNGDYEA